MSFKMSKDLKKPKSGRWIPATPMDIGKQCVIVGKKGVSCGKGLLKQVRFTTGVNEVIVEMNDTKSTVFNEFDDMALEEMMRVEGHAIVTVPIHKIEYVN